MKNKIPSHGWLWTLIGVVYALALMILWRYVK